WAVLGAVVLVITELVVIVLTGWMGPLVPLGAVAVLLYAAICWVSLPFAWLLVLLVMPFSREIVFLGIGSALWVPTEPLIFTFLAVWSIKSLLGGAIRVPGSNVINWVLILGVVT